MYFHIALSLEVVNPQRFARALYACVAECWRDGDCIADDLKLDPGHRGLLCLLVLSYEGAGNRVAVKLMHKRVMRKYYKNFCEWPENIEQ